MFEFYRIYPESTTGEPVFEAPQVLELQRLTAPFHSVFLPRSPPSVAASIFTLASRGPADLE